MSETITEGERMELLLNCLIALPGLSIGMMSSSTTIQSFRKGVLLDEDD